MNPNINILPEFNGKYLYKSIRLILLWVVLPVIIFLETLLFFFPNRIFEILRIINS